MCQSYRSMVNSEASNTVGGPNRQGNSLKHKNTAHEIELTAPPGKRQFCLVGKTQDNKNRLKKVFVLCY